MPGGEKKPRRSSRRRRGTGAASLHDLLRLRRWDESVRRCASHPHEAAQPRSWGAVRANVRDDVRQPTELPIHMAIRRCAPPAVVDAILGAHPAGVDAPWDGGGGPTPLHLLFSMQRDATDADVLRALVGRFPPSAQFLATSLGLPADVVAIVLSYVPHPAERRDGGGDTPLHCLCRAPTSTKTPRRDDLVRILASAAPRALGIPDHEGMLPLHSLLANPFGFDRSLARFLVSISRPSDLTAREKRRGATPLLLACALDAKAGVRGWSDVKLSLLRSEPAAAGVRDSARGFFPLWHYLANTLGEGAGRENNGATELLDRRVVAELARAAPEALTVEAPLEGLLPDVEKYFPEGAERNLVSYFQTVPFCDRYADLRDIFVNVVEAHRGCSKRRRLL